MFKGRKAWACMTVLVLLLGIVTPLGALAEVLTGTLEVEAKLYTTGDGQIYISSFDLYEMDEKWWDIADSSADYQFQWSVCGGAKQSALYSSEDDAWYLDTESSIRALVGKDVLRCNIFKSGRQVAALTIHLKGCVHAPTPVGDYPPDYEYIYFDAGKPVTIQVKGILEIGGGESIWYRFYKMENVDVGYYDVVEDLTKDGPITTASITFTPTAQDDRRTIDWEAATKGHDNWSYYNPTYILLDNAKKPIKMPSCTTEVESIELKEGESTILTLPVAIAGDTAKELEYRWYTYDDSVKPKLVQTGKYPSLSVTSKDVGTWRNYVCKVGYKGSAESTFLQYGQSFDVYVVDDSGNPITPSNPSQSTNDVPKTGDGTPLMAMFILLGVALAGTVALIGIRRRRSHS